MARAIRIITGIILFVFITGHLINLSLGLHSVELMDKWRGTFASPWINPIGNIVLITALVSHGMLGMVSLYRRNTLRMSNTDLVQFLTGFAILPLLAPHIVAIKLAINLIPDYDPAYQTLLHFFWIQNPLEGLRQILVVVLVWVHGAVGLLTYFRLQSWWARLGSFINPLIVIIPVAALLGFVEAGKQIIDESPVFEPTIPPPVILDALATISSAKYAIIGTYLAMLVLTLAARYFRLRGLTHQTRINYLNGPEIVAETGKSLLELAIINDVPHANLCRGRGRCGTCQVRVVSSERPLSPAEPLERATLGRIGADENTRLACQFKPEEGALVVERLIPPYIEARDLKEAIAGTASVEPVLANSKVEAAS